MELVYLFLANLKPFYYKMSANFGDNTRTQEIRQELQGDLSMIEGLTKADLFIENNSL